MDIRTDLGTILKVKLTEEELSKSVIEIVVPPIIDGNPIHTVTAVNLPEDVEEQKIILTLPEGLEVIESSTFHFDTNISEVNIPSTLKKIGSKAFESSNIKKVNIPKNSNLKTIGNTAFKATLIEEIFIPSSVTSISKEAFFKCAKLKKIEFGEKSKCKSIKEKAFSHCVGLTSFVLPDSVESIGTSAFEDCANLEMFSIASDDSKLQILENKAFADCVQLKSININSYSLHKITSSVFTDCYYLEELDLSNCNITNLKHFGTMLKRLSKIILPKKCKIIGPAAFEDCFTLKDVIFPDGLEEIGASAFCRTNLTKINLPVSLKKIGDYAFRSCKLTEMNFSILANLDEIGLDVFADNNFEHVDIYPMKASGIGLFRGNWALSSVEFHENESKITKIDMGTFMLCTNLKNIDISQLTELKVIDIDAFKGCSIEKITFPASLTEINSGAFCSNNLNEVNLTNTSVKVIGRFAFAKNKITKLELPIWIGQICKSSFEDTLIPLETITEQLTFSEIVDA